MSKVKYQRSNVKKGFTLVELIIVIAIVAILAGAIFVAIDPARRLHESRNARRWSDVNTILDGIKKYQSDNSGTHYTAIDTKAVDAYYMIGDAVSSCGTTCLSFTTESSCVDLSGIGNNYLALTPKDPKDGTAAKTQYVLKKDSTGAITIYACGAEGEGAGGTGTAPSIQVTR